MFCLTWQQHVLTPLTELLPILVQQLTEGQRASHAEAETWWSVCQCGGLITAVEQSRK